MRTIANLFIDLIWLAGAVLFAWYFLFSFVGIQAVSAAVTLALRQVERKWQ
jgi:hypothetical protein